MTNKEEKYGIYRNFLCENYLYLILIFLSLMIVTLCMQDTINYDEYFTMQWCRLNWKELMLKLIDDVHPPLYYCLLKTILDLTNESMFCARLLSAATGISLLWTGSLFLEHSFGKKSALFYVFFLYFNPFMVQKVTEVRMYMLASIFTIISGIMSYHILKEPKRKNWILFTFFSLLAAYTHYYALLSMVFLYAGILIYFVATRCKKGILCWLFYSFLTVIGYFPWLPTALKQIASVNRGFWISAPSSRLEPLRELFYTATPYTEHIYLGIIVLLTTISLLIFLKKRTRDGYWALMCCSALWGTFLLLTWYSSIRPVLLSRYLIMSLCLTIIGISSTAHSCTKYITIAICLYCTIIGGPFYIRYMEGALTQHNTTKTVAFAKEFFQENDLILYNTPSEIDNNYFDLCLQYYFPNIQCINMENAQMERWGYEMPEANTTIWFLDANHFIAEDNLLPEDNPLSGNISMENYGRYGFSSITFEIYRIEQAF